MKYKKQIADKAIGYDKDAPTAWFTLFILIVLVTLFIGETFISFKIEQLQHEISATKARAATLEEETEAAKQAKIIEIETVQEERRRQLFLSELRHCESEGDDFAVGDGGDSVGPYQWQKETLEDKLGRKVSREEYISIVTDIDTIHDLTYKTYFEDGEWWRWENCSYKLNHVGTN